MLATKAKRLRPATEQAIMKAIESRLNLIAGVRVWRQNTGAMRGSHNGKKRFVRFGAVGSADLTGLAWGRRLEVEVKRPGKKPTPEQVAFGRMVRSLGGIWFCAHSIDEAMAELITEAPVDANI